MKNKDMYDSSIEMCAAFNLFCNSHEKCAECPLDGDGSDCKFAWMFLDYEKAATATERDKPYEELRKICFGEMPFINCRICQGAKLGNCKSCSLGGARAVLAGTSEEAANG